QFILRKIRLIYEPVSMTILTDEKWMLFLLEQLLSNAIKYTPHGSVTISVTPEKVLQVADTGIGIAPEDLPRIFEKGFTGYNGRADKKSTGLGLYLCQQAAKKISVSLSVTSEVGKGSVFSVHLDIPSLQAE
ncbi:MAG: ATP-binding protein, partial [Ruminococcus sp.]